MFNLKYIAPVFALALGLLSVNFATAATEKATSFSLSVNTPTKVGTQVLTRGDYQVKFEGDNAVFVKNTTKATFSAPAKLEAGNEKFDHTTILSVQEAGQPRIISIELKGSKDLLKFN